MPPADPKATAVVPAADPNATRDWSFPELDARGVLSRLPPGSRVADCGCFGWSLAGACGERNHHLLGFDQSEPPGRPKDARFATMSGPILDHGSDAFDIVIANHVLEHMTEPLRLFGELARVVVPGGLLWVETPSELSALRPSNHPPTEHDFESFWDDPTHVRPYSPGALYRLALSWRCVPLHCARGVAGGIPVARLLARKPRDVSGKPPQTFVSLKDVPPGLAAAWAAIWPGAGMD